jgi:hypothetical protein
MVIAMTNATSTAKPLAQVAFPNFLLSPINFYSFQIRIDIFFVRLIAGRCFCGTIFVAFHRAFIPTKNGRPRREPQTFIPTKKRTLPARAANVRIDRTSKQ